MRLDKKSAVRLLLIALATAFFCFALNNFNMIKNAVGWIIEVLLPIILGLCIAFVLNPLVSSIERKAFALFKKKAASMSPRRQHNIRASCRGFAILASFLIVFGFLTFLMLIIIPEIRTTVLQYSEKLPEYFNKLGEWLKSLPFELPEWLVDFAVDQDWQKVIDNIAVFLKSGAGGLVSGVIDITASLLGGVWDFILGIIISIYVLARKERIKRFFKRLLSAYASEKRRAGIYRVASLSNEAFSSFVTGQLVEALIIGVLCYIGMLIFNFPFALPASAMIGITALIPIFGAWIGAGFGALLVASVSPVKALWFLLYIIILQQIEGNLIYPRVVGKTIGLPGLLVLIAVCVGGSVSGVTGMLFGVPICSILYTLINDSVAKRLASRAAEDGKPAGIDADRPAESGSDPEAAGNTAQTEAIAAAEAEDLHDTQKP